MPGDAHARLEAGHKALQAISKVLEDKPHKIDHDLSEALRALTDFRGQVIAWKQEEESEAARAALARLNSIISVYYGGQFPIGAVPWLHLEKAAGAFRELLHALEGAGAA